MLTPVCFHNIRIKNDVFKWLYCLIADDTETTKGLQINSVHVISPLTSSHINVLYKKTVFFQVVTKRIWMVCVDSL